MSDVPSAAPAAPAASSTPSAPAPTKSAPVSSAAPSNPSKDGSGASPAASNPAAKASSGVPDAKLPHQEERSDSPAPGNDHPDAKAGETKAETVQRIKLKTKVHGKEEEREYTTDELQLYVQKGLGADANFRESAEVKKTFASLQKALKENPFEALKDPAFGIDLEKLAIDHLAKKFEMEDRKAKDPVQYELEELRRFKADQEAQREAAEKQRQEAAAAEIQKREIAELKKSWNAALSKAGFGENEAFHRQLAEIGQDFLEAGLDLNPELLVSEFKNRLGAQQKTLMSGLKGESLVNYLGEDVVNELLAYKVAQINATKTQEPLPVAEPVQKTDEDDEKPQRPERYLSGYAEFMRSK